MKNQEEQDPILMLVQDRLNCCDGSLPYFPPDKVKELHKASDSFREQEKNGKLSVLHIFQGGYIEVMVAMSKIQFDANKPATPEHCKIMREMSDRMTACSMVTAMCAEGVRVVDPEKLEAIRLLRDCKSAEDVLAVRSLVGENPKLQEAEAAIKRLQEELNLERSAKAEALNKVEALEKDYCNLSARSETVGAELEEFRISHRAIEDQLRVATDTIVMLRKEVADLSVSKAQTPAFITVTEVTAVIQEQFRQDAEVRRKQSEKEFEARREHARHCFKASDHCYDLLNYIQLEPDIQAVLQQKPMIKAVFDLVAHEMLHILP